MMFRFLMCSLCVAVCLSAATVQAGNCGTFFCAPKQVAVVHAAPVVKQAVVVKQVAVPVYQPAYAVGYAYQQEANLDLIATRAAEKLRYAQLLEEVRTLRQQAAYAQQSGSAAGGYDLRAQNPSQALRPPADPQSSLRKYCSTCHGQTNPAGGLVFDAGVYISDESLRAALNVMSGEVEAPAQMRTVLQQIANDKAEGALMQEMLRSRSYSQP